MEGIDEAEEALLRALVRHPPGSASDESRRWDLIAGECQCKLSAGECRSKAKVVKKRLRRIVQLPRPVKDADDECVKVFLDIDIGGAMAAFERGAEFVKSRGLAYNLSSSDVTALGGSELSRLPSLYASDFEFSTKGRGQFRKPRQRVVIEVWKETAPLASRNFLSLVTGMGVHEPLGLGKCGKKLTYVGCPFHRVLENFIIQGGDFVTGTGSGGESIYGKKFKDDPLGIKVECDRVGLVGMCNSGKNSNTSQFFFSLGPSKKLKGKHTFFGQIVSGFDVLAMMSVCGAGGKLEIPVTVRACGLV